MRRTSLDRNIKYQSKEIYLIVFKPESENKGLMGKENKFHQHDFDLEERTARFGEAVIDFSGDLPHGRVTDVLVRQIVRSATSIGANYMEADCSRSEKDFVYKMNLCRMEAKETKHWLRMIAKANPESKDDGRKLWQEAHELTLIFSSIVSSRNN